MKKSSAALAVLFCTSIQLMANAGNIDPGGFVSIGVGTSDYSSTSQKKTNTDKSFKFKVVPMYSAELGYKFNRYLRAAFNPQYRVIKFSDSNNTSGTSPNINASSLAAIFNVYLDLYNYSSFTPYVFAGAGFGTFSYKIKNSAEYQKPHAAVSENLSAGIGIQAALSYNMGVDLSGRYSSLGYIKLQQAAGTDAAGQSTTSNTQKQKIRAIDIIISFYMLL